MIQELSEHTKRALDLAAPATTLATGAAAAITLSQIAVIITIIGGLLNIAWMLWRLNDRRRYGPSRGDSA